MSKEGWCPSHDSDLPCRDCRIAELQAEPMLMDHEREEMRNLHNPSRDRESTYNDGLGQWELARTFGLTVDIRESQLGHFYATIDADAVENLLKHIKIALVGIDTTMSANRDGVRLSQIRNKNRFDG